MRQPAIERGSVPARTILLAALLVAVPAAHADEPATGGAALYRRYCASCHGADGRGDGPAAASLTPPPTDLTRLDAGVRALMGAIDGRRTIRAHGTAAMPVWGEVFEQSLIGEPHRRRTALLQVEAIAEHVRSLRGAAR
jgi:mono/diheme cytochrome c family protein